MNKYLKKKTIAITLAAIAVALILLILVPSFPAAQNENNTHGYGYGYGVCPGTPGYWKNHPKAWPVDTVTIGRITYTKEEAIEIMKTPPRLDMTYVMFKHLVAAKLNVANGCESRCIEDAIDDADEWMGTYGPVGSNVPASSAAWVEGEPIKDLLDKYNNGQLCA